MNNKTISLFSQPFLDKTNQCYKNIVTLSSTPLGPLALFVKKIQTPHLSSFKVSEPCNPIHTCALALSTQCITNSSSCCDILTTDDIPNLISYLLENGYHVDTNITKMFFQSEIRFQTNNANKLICFITYQP